jgi:hypothetical protein
MVSTCSSICATSGDSALSSAGFGGLAGCSTRGKGSRTSPSRFSIVIWRICAFRKAISASMFGDAVSDTGDESASAESSK